MFKSILNPYLDISMLFLNLLNALHWVFWGALWSLLAELNIYLLFLLVPCFSFDPFYADWDSGRGAFADTFGAGGSQR